MIVPFSLRVGILVAVGAASVGGCLLTSEPLPQAQAYYDFADQRPLAGMPHMMNVVSNAPFLIVGAMGLAFMARRRNTGWCVQPSERWAYGAYFVGLMATALGSSYFHANPNNDTLLWDRLGLAMTFMALFTAILAERLHWRLSPCLVGPMVALGVGSVVYWHWTETIGAGDLRFYLIVQFFPLIVLPLLFALFEPRYTGANILIASLLCYGLAKGLELLDRQVYSGGGLVSGHTLKHLVAGVSAYLVLLMLQRRRPIDPPIDAKNVLGGKVTINEMERALAK